MSNRALSFENVKKSFGNFHALKGVNFDVKKGEFFTLLGPNGAGKTTLISCLAGMQKRDSGNILVDGYDPEIDPLITRNKLGIVQQEVSFDPFLNPVETLEVLRGFFGLPKDKDYTHWLLDRLSLWDKRDTRGRFLSGGMKRRVMIAKAMIHKPEILILDEPTAGVDVELRQSLWKFLEEIRKEHGITIILTTHYLEEAQALSDRIAILKQGEIIVCETKDKLLSKKQKVLELEFEGGKKESFPISSSDQISPLLESNKGFINLSLHEPSLEDIFLEFTQSK